MGVFAFWSGHSRIILYSKFPRAHLACELLLNPQFTTVVLRSSKYSLLTRSHSSHPVSPAARLRAAVCYTLHMSWAARRRLLILLIIAAVAAAFVATVSIATLYKTPTCTDSVENQGEAGIDCGGPCSYLCIEQQHPPTVLFTKTFTDTSTGRTVVVASVENKNNVAAAKDVPYRVIVYGTNQTLIQSVSGTFDLPPGATATVFIPGILSGKQTVVSAFLNIEPTLIKWFTMTSDPRIVPGVSNTIQGGSADAPRIEAILANGSTSALANVRVVVLVRDVNKDVIATSQTIVPFIRPQSTASAIFTWNRTFPGMPASIEIVPIIPLPDQ